MRRGGPDALAPARGTGATGRRCGDAGHHHHRARDPRHVPLLPSRDGSLAMSATAEAGRPSVPDRAALREARLEVEEFHYEYAAVLERGEIERWPDFFTEDAVYRLVARDHADSGLRLGLIYCEGRGVRRGRDDALKQTRAHAPAALHLKIVTV